MQLIKTIITGEHLTNALERHQLWVNRHCVTTVQLRSVPEPRWIAPADRREWQRQRTRLRMANADLSPGPR